MSGSRSAYPMSDKTVNGAAKTKNNQNNFHAESCTEIRTIIAGIKSVSVP